MSRVILGEKVNINPTYNNSKILYATTSTHQYTISKRGKSPSFWLDFKGDL